MQLVLFFIYVMKSPHWNRAIDLVSFSTFLCVCIYSREMALFIKWVIEFSLIRYIKLEFLFKWILTTVIAWTARINQNSTFRLWISILILLSLILQLVNHLNKWNLLLQFNCRICRMARFWVESVNSRCINQFLF